MTVTARLSDWYNNLRLPTRRIVHVGLLLLAALALVYIFFLPLKQVPMPLAIARGTPAATAATTHLWEILHADDGASLPRVIEELTAAYAGDSRDPVLVSVLGGAHLWRFMLRNRFGKSARELEPDLVQARRYGLEVIALTPNDRTSTAPSLVAAAAWQLAVLNGTPREIPDVHIDIMENSIVWPDFAAFMQGWVLAAMLPPDNPHYPEAAVGYDFMLDTCAGFRLPDKPRFDKFKHAFYGIKSLFAPACYNNPMAPHSISGTMISIGDLWLKAGDHDQARLWYENTKTAPDYATWKYKDRLEERLGNLERFQQKFRADSGRLDVTEPAMSFQSEFSCGICHTK